MMCKTVAPERGARIARMHSVQAQRFWGKSRNINEHVMNESCHTHKRHMSHTETSHVTHRHSSCHEREWAMWHREISFVTPVRLHDNASSLLGASVKRSMHASSMSHVIHIHGSIRTQNWVMTHQKKRHVTHWNVSRHTEINYVTRVYTNESSHAEKYVMSYTQVFFASHVTHRNETWHTQERVMVHTAMSHVTQRNELCYTQQWVMSHTAMSHVTPVSLFHVAIARGQSRDVKWV